MVAARRLGRANADVTTWHGARPVDKRDADLTRRPDKRGSQEVGDRARKGHMSRGKGLKIGDRGCDVGAPGRNRTCDTRFRKGHDSQVTMFYLRFCDGSPWL
jgi:hypothetical protein